MDSLCKIRTDIKKSISSFSREILISSKHLSILALVMVYEFLLALFLSNYRSFSRLIVQVFCRIIIKTDLDYGMVQNFIVFFRENVIISYQNLKSKNHSLEKLFLFIDVAFFIVGFSLQQKFGQQSALLLAFYRERLTEMLKKGLPLKSKDDKLLIDILFFIRNEDLIQSLPIKFLCF